MVFQVLNRLKWSDGLKRTEIVILSRGSPDSEKTIKGEDITEIKKTYLIFSDAGKETFIPLHRVLEVRRGSVTLWKRKGSGK
jgi:uncharacterized protein (UPF0248 family)